MKQTFFLIGVLGLLAGAGVADGSDRTWNETTWSSESDAKNVTLGKDDKLIINLGSTEVGTVVDLGTVSISNNVVTGEPATINTKNPPDDVTSTLSTYTYGALHLADDANVQFSKNQSWSYVGTLSLGENATLNLHERSLAVTGVPYVSMGVGAEITLGAKDATSKVQGTLSFGASNQIDWDAIVVTGAYGEAGHIRNTSTETATLGTESAVNVEYVNTIIKVQGDEATTPIVAKMSNAAIVNQSRANGTVVVSGGAAEAGTTAVTQINTGIGTSYGGDVTLLNRGSSNQKMDTLLIGNHTITAKQGDADSEAAVIEINAFDASKTYDVGGYDATPGLIAWEEGASLDADLMLGTGKVGEAVYFHNYNTLNMKGNDVTLNSGILIVDPNNYGTTIGTEVLLFTNVNSLTLGDVKYDNDNSYNSYFDYTSRIAASTYFSSDQTSATGMLVSVDELTTDAEGNIEGWFIEYRDNGNNDGTGDVYLTYNAIYVGAVVPEPATATLSLLALAGLAARRRRK